MAALVLEIGEGALDVDRTLSAFAAEHSVALTRTLGCREGTVRSLAARAFATLRKLPEFSEGTS